MTEKMNKYLKPNVVSTILNASEKEFRKVVRGGGVTAKKEAANKIDEFIKDTIKTYRKAIGSAYQEQTQEKITMGERRSLLAEMREEVKAHLMTLETEKAERDVTQEIGLQEHLMDTITDVLYDAKHVRYDNAKIKTEDILSTDFSADLITLAQGKKVNADAIESDVKVSVFIEGMPIPKHIKNNLMAMTNRIKELSKRTTARFKIHRHEIQLKKIFGSDTQRARDARERRATYRFWKGVAKDQDSMIKELEKLVSLLKEANPKNDDSDKDVLEFIKFMDSKPDLEYVYPFESKSIGFADLNARSYQFLLNFLKLFNYDVNFRGKGIEQKEIDEDSPIKDNVDLLEDAYVTEGLGEEDEQGTKTDAAVSERQSQASRLTIQDKTLRNASDDSDVKELIEDADKMDYDPLGILVVKDDLDGLMPLFGEIDEIEDYLKEKLTFLDIDEDDEEALFKTFVEDLERIDSLANSQKNFHLPIFAANNAAMRTHYPELKAKTGKVTTDIDRFLELFANLLQDEKGTLADRTRLDMMGAGTGKPQTYQEGEREVDPAKIRYFKYVNTASFRRGSPRQAFGSLKSKNSKITAQINRVVKDMAEVFITPQQIHLDAGISLPFKNNYAMRYIAANKKLDSKFAIYSAINKKFMETGEAFIDEEYISDLITFPKLLSQGDAIQTFEKVKSAGVKFAKALYKIAQSIDKKEKNINNKIKDSIQKDVAAILGSIRSITGRREEFFMNNEWGNNIGIMESYRNSRKDSFEDITVLKTVVDLLESKHGETAIPNENERKKLLENLADIKKSEVHNKLLSVYDAIRLIKEQPVYYSKKKLDNLEHMSDMINKMEKEYYLDISASEISSIVNDMDSFDSISKSYGISTEHIYVIKANFR